ILSMLLTAATVVFVNQVQDYKTHASTATAERNAAVKRAQDAEAATAAQSELLRAAQRDTQAQLEQKNQSLNTLQSRINELSAQYADLSAKMALQSADLNRVTEALKSSEDTKSKQQDQITTMRQTMDERLKQNVELNTAVSELSNKLSVTERERKFLAEQLNETKNTVDKQTSLIRDLGGTPAMLATAGVKGGAPSINGIIREKRDINNVPYATISVGSNDSVTKGMEFKIINRETGAFLGILTIDTVEQNESTGRISGPRIAEVRAGLEVRTQL
ncbi:MAG: hypothetical protein ACREJC_04990, partial [Tepidisphaeraceae bacterium]